MKTGWKKIPIGRKGQKIGGLEEEKNKGKENIVFVVELAANKFIALLPSDSIFVPDTSMEHV